MNADLQKHAQNLRREARAAEEQARKLRRAADALVGCSTYKRRGPKLAGLSLIKERGLSYRAVSTALGYSKKTVENVLRGESQSQPLLVKLADYLGVPLSEVAAPFEVSA